MSETNNSPTESNDPVRFDVDPNREKMKAEGYDGSQYWDIADYVTAGTETTIVDGVDPNTLVEWLSEPISHLKFTIDKEGNLDLFRSPVSAVRPSVIIKSKFLDKALDELEGDEFTIAFHEDEPLVIFDGQNPVLIAPTVPKSEVSEA